MPRVQIRYGLADVELSDAKIDGGPRTRHRRRAKRSVTDVGIEDHNVADIDFGCPKELLRAKAGIGNLVRTGRVNLMRHWHCAARFRGCNETKTRRIAADSIGADGDPERQGSGYSDRRDILMKGH